MTNTINKTRNERIDDLIRLKQRDDSLVLYFHFKTIMDEVIEDLKQEEV